eukprot:SAG31_NODE_186_length_20918_cov_26.890917_13_plen_112_part_00
MSASGGRYGTSAEAQPLILPLASGQQHDSTSLACTKSPAVPDARGLIEELSELVGLSKQQLYLVSILGIIFKVFAACLLYLAYKHHLGPFAVASPHSDVPTTVLPATKPLY